MRVPQSGLRIDSPKYCECGCGQGVRRRFVKGHQIRVCNPAKNPDVAMKVSSWHKGQPLTVAHKQAISNKLKGITTWNKGLTKETDISLLVSAGKISQSLKGRKRPIDETTKAAKSNKGKKRDEQAKLNISMGHLGQVGWNTGLKGCYSQQTLRKMALAKKGNTCHKGIPQTEKMKELHSHKMKTLWADKNSTFNNIAFLQARAKARRISPNKLESLLIDLIRKNELPFKYVGDGSFMIERYNPDFVNINGQKQIIELYGDYWHRNDDPQYRIDLFAKYGFATLVVWESELENDPDLISVKIKEFMNADSAEWSQD